MNEQQKEQMRNTHAYDVVSFDPEKRMENFIREFEQCEVEIENKCKEFEGVDVEKIKQKHFDLAVEFLNAESRCMSWAITGPAKFPVKRAEARQRTSEDRLNRLVDFRNGLEKYLKKITRATETEDDKKEKWEKQIEQLKARQEMMKDVNAMIRKGLKKEAEEKYGLEEIKPDCFGVVGYPAYKLSNNLANIKRLEEQVKKIDAMRNTTNEGFEVDGVKVEYDPTEIRYNIYFASIPDEVMRTKLKSHGFKWSPRRQAWTRGAKTMSINTIKEILGVLK